MSYISRRGGRDYYGGVALVLLDFGAAEALLTFD
jgi:hypothetical protein